jgi:hypothetical protein
MQLLGFVIILSVLLVIESTLIAYPFVFVLLFLLFMRHQSIVTLVIVFIFGCIIDSLRVVPLGTTALFSFGLFFILFLYNRSLQLSEIMLLLIACFGATFIYSIVAHYPLNIVLHLLVFSLLFVVVYKVRRKHEAQASPYIKDFS